MASSLRWWLSSLTRARYGRPLGAELLTTTTSHGLTIASPDQGSLDAWLATKPGSPYEVRDFVVWAHRRHHARDLLVPHRPPADPVGLRARTPAGTSYTNASPTPASTSTSAPLARSSCCSANTSPGSQHCPPPP
ncbi:hypothetical protein ACIQM0_18975 [Streptomyces sp. NPDC091387]|uniref:hypothetical protein n=1 Tax=Streptomyces sp. NPDC091387 TaxID=3365998 RepID=UPI003821C6F2